MKQLFGTADGRVVIKEMPAPTLRGAGAIVQTRFSAISVGTEGTVLRQRREKSDPNAGEWAPGYSNAGVIVETSTGLNGFCPGDLVACAGGGYAPHAEQCFVTKNLLARCGANVDMREAAFATLGTIAMQGLRRGRIEVGETVAILGLGMIGQLAAQIAKAAGMRVIGVDTNEARMKLASQLESDVVAAPQNALQAAKDTTHGRGVDAVIITAGTPTSSAPLVQALEMVRDRGRVVVVGNVKCEFPRDLWFYKDAELLISRSYGPGRYDSQYEENGHDYPVGYVRWTEGRNLQEFVRLLGAGQVKVAPLITHEFPFERAPEAYEELLAKPGECLGCVLKY